MSKLINLFEEAKIGDIVLYPICEIYKNHSSWDGCCIDVSYQREGKYIFKWEVCSVNKEEKKVMIKPYKLPFYFGFLDDEGFKQKIHDIWKYESRPISVPIGNDENKQYVIIFDKDYTENIFVSKKDKINNNFSPILVLKSDLMAAETTVAETRKIGNGRGRKTVKEKAWQIFPTQITQLDAIKKCILNCDYYLDLVKKMKIKSVLTALVNSVDEDYFKEYISLLKENNPEIVEEIMELAKNEKSREIIIQIFNALLKN